MLYIPKIDYYLEILTDEEVMDFVSKKFNETTIFMQTKSLFFGKYKQ